MIQWAKHTTDELYSIIADSASDAVLTKWSRLLKCDIDRDAILDAAHNEHLIYHTNEHEEEHNYTLCDINRIAVFVTARKMHIDEEYAECIVVKKAIDDAARLGKSAHDVYVPISMTEDDFFSAPRYEGLHLESLISEEENTVYYLGQDNADIYTKY